MINDDFLGLQSKEQIEAKFQEMVELRQRQQMASLANMPTQQSDDTKAHEQSVQQKHYVQGHRRLQKSMAASTQSMLTTNHTTPLKHKKAQSNEYIAPFEPYDERNYLLKFATRLEFLVTKCTDDNDFLRMEALRGIEDLGVNPVKVCQLETHEQRENYLIQQLREQVLEQLRQWSERQVQKELGRKKEEQRQHRKQDKEHLKIFDWIDLQSKFISLKQKLKFALVEVINDRHNQRIIDNFLQDKNAPKQLQLQNYPQPDIREIIDELTNLLRIVKAKKQPPRPANSSQFSSHPLSNYDWDSQKEAHFQSNRQSAKQRLSHMIKSSSWNNVGMAENIRAVHLQNKNFLQRESLMDKYAEGDFLNEAEMQYLANTSVLLNKCSDKKYIQHVINLLDEDIINDVELFIAENILKNFNAIRSQIKSTRQNYISSKTAITKQVNQIRAVKQQKEIKVAQSQRQNDRIKSKIVSMLKQLHRSKQESLTKEQKHANYLRSQMKKGNLLANPYIWKFKEKMMNVVLKKRQAAILQKKTEEFIERNTKVESQKPFFHIKGEPYSAHMIKRLYHPSSKLFIQSEEKTVKSANISKECLNYQLGIRKKEYQKESTPFKGFYSGGPIRSRPFANRELNTGKDEEESQKRELPYKGEWIDREIEVQAANKIKSCIKRYMQQKKLRLQKEETAFNEQKQIEKKVKKYLESKALFEFISRRKSIDQQQNPNKIGTFISPELQKFKNDLLRGKKKKKQHQSMNFEMQKPEKEPKKKEKMNYDQVKVPKKMIDLNLKPRKLFLAVKVGNLYWMKHSGFVFTPQDLNCYDTENNSPLYYAARNGDIEFCNFLLNLGADVNQPCSGGDTPLFYAFASNNIHLINIFLSYGGDIYLTNEKGQTAISFGSDKVLEELNLVNNVASKKDKGKVKSGRPSQISVDNIWDGKGTFEHEPVEDVQERKVSSYKSPEERKRYHEIKEKAKQDKAKREFEKMLGS